MIRAGFRPGLWPLYLLYTLVLTGVLLYVRFPQRGFAEFCSRYFAIHMPGAITTIGAIHYHFPRTMIFDKVQITSKNNPGESLNVDQLRLSPHILSPRTRFDIALTAYKGTAQALLRRTSPPGSYQLEKIRVKDMDLAALTPLRTRTGRTISGKFSGQGSYSGQWGHHLLTGSAEGVMEIRNGSVELLTPLLSLKSLSVEQGSVLIKLQKQALTLSKGAFTGQEVKGELNGKLTTLTGETGAMQLDFVGTLTPAPDLIKKNGASLLRNMPKNQGLPFHLKGTMGKPVFLFDSFQG